MKLAIHPLMLLLVASAAQGAYVISQSETNSTFGNAATGQSFTPGVGMSLNPGPNISTIDLTSFSLWANSGTAAGTPSTRTVDTTYLLIYDANPVGAANLVGSSTNSIDLNPFPGTGSKLTWSFSNLTLSYNKTYFAVVASSAAGTDTNDIGIGMQVSNLNPYSGGTGLTNNFAVGTTQDAKFEAIFANPVAAASAVPEPGGMVLVAGLLSGGCLIRGRRR